MFRIGNSSELLNSSKSYTKTSLGQVTKQSNSNIFFAPITSPFREVLYHQIKPDGKVEINSMGPPFCYNPQGLRFKSRMGTKNGTMWIGLSSRYIMHRRYDKTFKVVNLRRHLDLSLVLDVPVPVFGVYGEVCMVKPHLLFLALFQMVRNFLQLIGVSFRACGFALRGYLWCRPRSDRGRLQ